MSNWDYKELILETKLLEIKLKRISLTKSYLITIKPTFLEFKKKKQWKNKFNSLLEEEENLFHSLQIAYTNLEKL